MEPRPPSPINLPPSLAELHREEAERQERIQDIVDITRISRPRNNWTYLTIRQETERIERRVDDLDNRIRSNLATRLRPEVTQQDLQWFIQEEKVLRSERQRLERRLDSALDALTTLTNIYIPRRADMPFSRTEQRRRIRQVGNLSPEEEAMLPDNPPPTDEALAMLQRLGLRPSPAPPRGVITSTRDRRRE